MTTFDRVKVLAEKQKISIVELEEKLGFGRNSLYSWKKKTPNGENLKKVADYFNVTTDYLLGRSKNLNILETIAAHIDPNATEKELQEIINFIEEKQKQHQKEETIDLVKIASKYDEDIAKFVKENPDFRYEVLEQVSDEEAVSSVKSFIEIYKQNNL
ncbi:helix-turn-helix transcriptional regulator [Listeria welshimeri]|uniref:Phage associated repressor, putative n=1 Tax=Listeria welshimeri serovar 6b (strain ATCC 35897 / DSM 20650 / CCUG 15529 / CIP 8149 / NCTC 11857 / SLCC 5334 / V8) TaxID=386043 RepID=A0AHY3_LISW6|nr:helix-turn-helix transcriptional regulator [Listeria welshimeri]EAW7204186.1 helix-turn-helix transcriptional regulator [Listeria monocytogenes]MBC1459713.1 helix-turn-helix transcriptional regulator [Listeria welshimeri]MBC2041856.1 helix-turn-helix transcriptional regulator [Listeria welshimeri]CAK20615.1 phage associated repressor, putative [Listeria welshimeri serovar 6b str. SLCC5334]SNV22939.1 Helix-turn-helix domain [Listeria welshimeri]